MGGDRVAAQTCEWRAQDGPTLWQASPFLAEGSRRDNLESCLDPNWIHTYPNSAFMLKIIFSNHPTVRLANML